MTDELSFGEIAEALKQAAQAAAETCERTEQLVARFPADALGPRADLARVQRHAIALGRAHHIFRHLARYEREVCRLVRLSRHYAGRRRWWLFRWSKP